MAKEITKKESAFENLEEKMKLFVLEVVRTGNQTAAYKLIFPNASTETAKVNGCKLTKTNYIATAIQEMYDELYDQKKQEIGRTFQELTTIAHSSIADIIDINDGELTVKDLNSIDARAVQSFSYSETETKDGIKKSVSIRLFDKVKALTELIRLLQMTPDDNEKMEIVITPAVRPDRPKKIEEDGNE